MDVFEVHERLISDYDAFTSSLVQVRDGRLLAHLEEERRRRARWPEPWLSLNPAFASGGTVTELVEQGLLHRDCERLFRIKESPDDPGGRPLTLHRHQLEAVRAAAEGDSYVLTTGTGSGKSLSYMVPIVHSVLSDPEPGRIKAIVVYPMNALANSQLHELERYLQWGVPEPPVTFARYTGQESQEDRDRILARKPDILLTNYVMLEYLLTRPGEREHLIGAARGLRFLVLDELHTYRGRQGADVALLVRRLRDACDADEMQCVGTSATMATSRTFAEARQTVADVATRLFGTEIRPERVIGETLVRSTEAEVGEEALKTSMRAAGGGRAYAELATDPLAAWIEMTFGLAQEPGSGRLVRKRPTKVADAARSLAELTGEPEPECRRGIEALLLEASKTKRPGTPWPLFAFRLHQFLSKGDTVYVSLENEHDRYITSQYQVSVPGDRGKLLLPLAFCRECGQEYVVVARTAEGYAARQEQDVAGGDDVNGYLYISSDHPWPADPISAGRLPDSWLEAAPDGGTRVVPRLVERLPREVWVDPSGHERQEGQGIRAAYLPSPFRFCLRCRVSYEQPRGRDFAKLATFAAEGRSSAMSLISTSIVRSLRTQESLSEQAKKLLTFVDNRQDASLQAGHFNDFVQITQLRGALYRAASKGDLGHEDVAQQVARALDLPMEAFAQNPGARFGQREAVLRALRTALEYYLYLDLERGWRVTMPNLEQTGLLRFDYVGLEEIAADDEHWPHTHPVLANADPAKRAYLCRIVLDEMRRALAIDVEALSSEGIERLQRLSDQHLTGAWALPPNSRADSARTVYPRTSQDRKSGGNLAGVHFTGRSALGRYLRQEFADRREFAGHKLSVDDAQQLVIDLLHTLTSYDLLVQTDDKGYRLRASALIWRAGDGTNGAPDPLRKTVDPEVGSRVNLFFRDLYRDVADKLVGLFAAEHTAQVRAEDRERREEDFREGRLKLLYCSPTMELGVDIATLNAVGLRNVPPTPANYAQRSGRAGRSGQPALVTTYCSTGSAHDQYYFRRSQLMVAGSVQPPRLDLTNEDLIRSHVHAIWLAETRQSLRTSMIEILTGQNLEVDEDLARSLADRGVHARAIQRARHVLADLTGDLRRSAWWHENWIEDTVSAAAKRFNEACERWRSLYTGALREQQEQNRRVLDNSTTPDRRREAEGRRRQAENQLRLLKNEEAEQQYSDFYSYRYFASEGFLPGYSFPRLPLAAYIPGQRNKGTYIQRPRFIAVGEFGPGALIYHEGQRYQVTRIQVPAGETGDVATTEARICASCGYWHERQPGLDRCEECGAELTGVLGGLMHLQTVHTVRRQRISSDEEERRRAGFELQTSFRFSAHGARSGRLEATVANDDGPLAELIYGDTATVRVLNKGRKRRKNANDIGYWLDPTKGKWISESDAADRSPEDEGLEDPKEAERVLKIVPYVEDRKNICVLRLAQKVDETTAVSLRYALERGIEAEFQLEDAELTSEQLPDLDDRGRMLFIESAEGGAGVLRRLHDEPDALAKAARRALEIIHVDPDTGEDERRAPDAREDCERGCYDCLLSYTNQGWHKIIDRHTVIGPLRDLANATTGDQTEPGGVDGRLAELQETATSDVERDLVEFLRKRGHRLPDSAGELVDDALARPDFVYWLPSGSVAVFLDDADHDPAEISLRDLQAQYRLEDLGWLVVRFARGADWSEVTGRYPSVFGPGRDA